MTQLPYELLPGIDWHDEEMASVTQTITTAVHELDGRLQSEINRTDFVIGGMAVTDRLTRQEPYVGPRPTASLTLEHWWVNDENSVVRLARSREDTETLKIVPALASQVRGTGNWIAGVEQRRMKKIARLAGQSLSLHVDMFSLDSKPDDEAFKTMRASAEYGLRRDDNHTFEAHVGGKFITPIDKPKVLSRARGYVVQSKMQLADEQADFARRRADAADREDTVITDEEVANSAQALVARKLGNLTRLAENLGLAQAIIAGGRRIGPSQAQHNYPVWRRL